MRPPFTTIEDVAARAGVSITTVSHVRSGKRPVNAATAERVTQAMRELHYTPNRAARTLALGSAQTLGLLVPDITNTFFAELAKGAEDKADSLGYAMLLGNSSFDPARELHYLNALRSRAIDGLIYVAGAPPNQQYLAGLARHFPVAVVDEALTDVRAVSVLSDNRKGGGLVADLLDSLGHRSILLITGPHDLPSSAQRTEGFLAALGTRSARNACSVRTVEGAYDQTSGYRTVAELLRRGDFNATAVFALNDLMAVGAMRALQYAGVSVPGDVTVVGYDDTVLASSVTPGLTTVHQPAYEMGARAAAEVLRGVASGLPPTPVRIVLDVNLVERDSSGTARA